MEQFQTLPTDEDVKWDKLLDNIMKSADAILWGTTSANTTPPLPPPPPPLPLPLPPPPSPKEEARPLAVAAAASEHKGATDLLPLASGQDHMELLMEGQPLDVDDELSNVLDDFWLPDYLVGQPGSIDIQDQVTDPFHALAHSLWFLCYSRWGGNKSIQV